MCPRCGYQYPSSSTSLEDIEETIADRSDLPRYTLSDEEVDRRLPALNSIKDASIRNETRRLTATAPAYFWVVPAAAHKYHNPLCRGTHGLWLHTLMVAQAVEDLLWTYEDRGFIDDRATDYALSAALLHDQRKNGLHESPSESSVSDHDLQMAQVIREESSLPDVVADAVASHMGPSYDGPTPDPGCLDDLVHMADYAASRRHWTVSIQGPLPKEFEDVDVPVVRE